MSFRCSFSSLSGTPHQQDVTHFAFACASLWIIHTAPDVCAFINNAWKLASNRSKTYRVVTVVVFICRSILTSIQIVLFEACRAAGLTLLTMGVFPLLDVPRCVVLGCGIVMFSYLHRVISSVWNSLVNVDSPISRRFLWMFSSVPFLICFMILATSTVVFAWQDNHNKFHQILPTAMILCAIGFWECWIDVESANGMFNAAFEVK